MKNLLCLIFLTVTAIAQEKPNIVIFLADDHGFKDNSVFGSQDIRTPKMASLAVSGMRFNQAFVASPACGPSRAALLSGLMPARNGAEANHMMPRPSTLTMVAQLRAQGYEVAAFGKVGHGKEQEMAGFSTQRNYAGHDGTKLVKLVRDYLDQRSSTKPLCLMVGDHRPHVSWIKDATYDPNKVKLPPGSIDTKETREHFARYLTDVTNMDQTMAEVDKLARKHFGNDSYLFAYTSDHGAQWPFGKWNLYDTGVRTPLIIRWPGKIKPDSKTDAMVSWVDLMPTLLDIAGADVPADIDGRSFKNVLLGETGKHRDLIFTTHSGDGIMNVYPIRSVRTPRFKYIRNLRPDSYHSNHSDILRKDGAGAYWDSWDAAEKSDPAAAKIIARYYQRPKDELYDLEKDPNEQVNLAANPEYQQQLKKMSQSLDEWMKLQNDQETIFKEPYPTSGPRPVDAVKANHNK